MKRKKQGYQVHFFFLMVPSVDLALTRVRGRVLRGGHDIPEAIIRRRFGRSIHNFLGLYRHVADSQTLFDNSGDVPVKVAAREQGREHLIK